MDPGEDAFVDTAAVIKNLDLVITCDSVIAHLAVWLGHPTGTLLRFVPDCVLADGQNRHTVVPYHASVPPVSAPRLAWSDVHRRGRVAAVGLLREPIEFSVANGTVPRSVSKGSSCRALRGFCGQRRSLRAISLGSVRRRRSPAFSRHWASLLVFSADFPRAFTLLNSTRIWWR